MYDGTSVNGKIFKYFFHHRILGGENIFKYIFYKYVGENIFKYIFSQQNTVVKIYLNIFSFTLGPS